MPLHRLVYLCALIFCLFPSLLRAEPRYTFTDLGPALSVAALNAQGVPVGSYIDTTLHAQVPGVFRPTGPLHIATFGQANGIANDTAVGFAVNGAINQEAFAWTPQRGTKLLGLLPGGFNSAATGVNGLTVTVGYGSTAAGTQAPIVWWLGQRWTLPLPHGGEGHAAAVSPWGRVVGEADTGDVHDTFHAMLWYAGQVKDLGTLGGPYSGATGVNDTPLVVGWSDTPTSVAAMTWTPRDGMMALPSLGPAFPYCRALGVSSVNVIVGACFPPRDGSVPSRAVVWEHGRVQDLQTLVSLPPTWILEQASSVNAHGQIAGIGRLGRESRGWVLTPGPAQVAGRR